MRTLKIRSMVAGLIALGASATLNSGDAIRLTLRGVPTEEQQKINGEDTVSVDRSLEGKR